MSISYNRVVLIGRLTRDPDFKFATSGTAILTFGIAVDREYSKNNETDFFNVICFGKTAEVMNQYLKKGILILVEGSVQIEKYDDRDGNKKTATKIVANKINFMQKKNESYSSNEDQNYKEVEDKDKEDITFFGSDSGSDEIPF